MNGAPALPTRETRLALLDKVGQTLLSLPYKNWNFGDSVGFEGIIETGKLLNQPTYEAFAYGWMRSWASRPEPFRRLDCTAPGYAMVEIATKHHDKAILDSLSLLANYLTSRPKDRGIFDVWESLCLMTPYGGEELPEFEAQLLANPPGGSCVDCMHFDPPFFTALGKEIGNRELVDIGVDQAINYINELQTENGIFDHFFLTGVPGAWAPGWGRGQGWALLGMLDVLKSIDSDHPGRAVILESTRKLITSMIELQRLDGRWWCVVHSEVSGEEGSTAAFMATGFARAIKLGIVDASETLPAMRNALAGAIDDTDSNGQLKNVTAAVYASTRQSHYEFTPRGFSVPWGQGPLALAICETFDLV
jgi:unsaturated rhamnogalacturonyl hydrolase